MVSQSQIEVQENPAPIDYVQTSNRLDEPLEQIFPPIEGGKYLGLAKPTVASVTALAVAACGGAPGTPTETGGVPPIVAVRMPQSDAEAARFILRASLSANQQMIDELRSEGFEPWLDRHIPAPNDQTAEEYLVSNGLEVIDSGRHYERPDRGDWMIWSQMFSGGNTLRKRFALALSEYFVVSLNNFFITWPATAIGEYWDILNRNAFGNFRDLLEEITLCPAMGIFLNTRGNRKADPATGRVPDENYGREVMQLFTIGLFELNPDGTQRLSNGQPIETYTNEDVTGIAKVFTGYDIDAADAVRMLDFTGSFLVRDARGSRRPMTSDHTRFERPARESQHSLEEKTFLGLTIPPGTGAEESLRLCLDHLVAHPNVGPFFSRQMIQRLVTSNPSPAYVQRVAAVFDNNGQGVRGDLGAVFKAILLDDEALDPANANSSTFGKLREPMLRYIQFARTFNATTISGRWQVGGLSDQMTSLGQSPLRPPSVFNFFRPQYFPTNSQIADQGLLAPEFQLVNEISVAGYVNFIESVIPGSRFPVADVALDYSAEVAMADDPVALLDRLDLIMTGNQLTTATRDLIIGSIESVSIGPGSEDADRLRRVQIAVLLILSSPDYLIQK